MKLENLWLHAFNSAVKNGIPHDAGKIANQAVESWRVSKLPYEIQQWQLQTDALSPVTAKEAMENFTKALNQTPQPETEEVFYWKDVSEFTKEDAVMDVANFLIKLI
jgi:hypothetical protein